MKLKRTHTCGQLRKSDAGREVVLNGWIHAKREHGGLTFIDLRDRYGKTQVVFDASQADEAAQRAKGLGLEDVIAVRGQVVARPPESLNRDLATGEVFTAKRGQEVGLVDDLGSFDDALEAAAQLGNARPRPRWVRPPRPFSARLLGRMGNRHETGNLIAMELGRLLSGGIYYLEPSFMAGDYRHQ